VHQSLLSSGYAARVLASYGFAEYLCIRSCTPERMLRPYQYADGCTLSEIQMSAAAGTWLTDFPRLISLVSAR
jgi:hypothetical protein